jgi:hypothetical protein
MVREIMTVQDIKAGQELSREMLVPGNLLRALDEYAATHPQK